MKPPGKHLPLLGRISPFMKKGKDNHQNYKKRWGDFVGLAEGFCLRQNLFTYENDCALIYRECGQVCPVRKI
jgi:hypothetical protein